MTRDETKAIIKRVRSLYISQARQYKESDWQLMIDAWHEQFANESYADVNNALTLYVNSGKQFIPNVADIINEMMNADEPQCRSLFERLKRECDIVVNGLEHVVIDDLGGVRKDPDSPTGYRHVVAEAHITNRYTQTDFANLPIELQIYAEDIRGLESLYKEICSNEIFAYRRFRERMPYVRKEMEKGTE